MKIIIVFYTRHQFMEHTAQNRLQREGRLFQGRGFFVREAGAFLINQGRGRNVEGGFERDKAKKTETVFLDETQLLLC